MALDQPVAQQLHPPRQTRADVYIAWQYRDDPESVRREFQYLGVFTTEALARARTAKIRDDGWIVQVTPAQLDPEEVC